MHTLIDLCLCILLADINECELGTPCDPNASCTDAVGSFDCLCNAGYTGSGLVCTSKWLGERYAYNSAHNYSCTFLIMHTIQIIPYQMITDIDECEMGTDICDENANCTDTIGSFSCTCNSGYSGDGVNCLSEFLFDLKVHYVLLMVLFRP